MARKKKRCLVVCWEMSHNPVGRAVILADILKRNYEVVLAGPTFSKYGDGNIWKPLRGYPIDTRSFKAGYFPQFIPQAKKFIRSLGIFDVVVICKPRLPSLLIGFWAASSSDAKVVLDIDDHELSFFDQSKPLELDAIDRLADEELEVPFSESWTRVCESLIPFFDHRIVSNSKLQEKFGGSVISHVRDEKRFKPSRIKKLIIRTKLGFKPSDQIVLFLGTPREHKGFLDVADALLELADPRIKYCIIGTKPEKKFKKKLSEKYGNLISYHSETNFHQLPNYLQIADLICLIQDQDHPTTEFQIPAKFNDALAMGIPVLATPAGPLEDLGERGLIEILNTTESLTEAIKNIFGNYSFYKKKALGNRKSHFRSEFSYESALNTLLEHLQRPKKSFPLDLELFFRKLEKQFRIPPDPSQKLDLVFFWKQNDSGIYGRRQDMFVKHLSQHPSINKVIHFDVPMNLQKLLKKKAGRGNKFIEDGLVYDQTVRRIKGEQDETNVLKYTFLFGRAKNSLETAELKQLKRKANNQKKVYPTFVSQVLSINDIDETKSFFWFCPSIESSSKIMSLFAPAYIVSDFIDDQRAWALTPDRVKAVERDYELMSAASDLSICNNEQVETYLKDLQANPLLITNGLEKEEHDLIEKPEFYKKLKGPIIGYVGNLDPDRLNVSWIKHIAAEKPDWNIVIIGSAHKDLKILDQFKAKNIHCLGLIPYEDCKAYIKYFDVAIIPHFDNIMTKSMNPLKYYVYRSFGLPIVSSGVSGMSNFDKKNFSIAHEKEDFMRSIEESLKKRTEELPKIDQHLFWRNKTDSILNRILKV